MIKSFSFNFIFRLTLFFLMLYGSEATLAQPSSQQAKILRATGLKIVIPNYVPKGFVLGDIEVQAERNPKSDRYTYTLFYRDANGLNCFGIQGNNLAYTGTDIVDADTKVFNINSSIFGKSALQVINNRDEVSGKFMRSLWLTKSPPCEFNDDRCGVMGYRFIGATQSYPQLKRCQDVSISEAIKITESFRYLNP